MSIKIDTLNNLEFTEGVCNTLRNDRSLTSKARVKVISTLSRLNEFGLDKDFVSPKQFKRLQEGWYELRIKEKSDCWRILFRQIKTTNGILTYGIIHMFLKDTDPISDIDWKKAKRQASSENWF